MIEFKCTECGMQLQVADEAEGKRGKCTQCGTVIAVPEAELVKLEAADSKSVPHIHGSASKPRASRNVKRQKHRTRPREHRIWVLFLVITAVVATPFVPMFPLWFGIVLLVLCIFAFVPGVQLVSHHLLKLNPSEKWRTGFRVTAYSVIGLVLIFAGKIGADYKVEQQQIAIEKAAEEAERQLLINEANSQLATLVAEAETAWKAGNSIVAGTKLDIAIKTPNATKLSPVRNLRARIANANVEVLITEATIALNESDIETARSRVAAAIAVPYANSLAEARKLDEQIGNATDPEHTRSLLMKLSDEEFQQLKHDGIVPAQIISGYEVLDRIAVELANKQLQKISSAREERRQVRLEAEKQRREEDRLAAESAHNAEKERQEREEALRAAAQKEIKDRLDSFLAILKTAEVVLIKYVSVRKIGDHTWEATLTVDNLWHIRHYQIRLQDAQTLWEAWALIASPKDPDSARIKLVDQRDNKVGGSRVWAGSLIWVNED